MEKKRKLIISVSIAVMVCVGCFLLWYLASQEENSQIYDDMRDQTTHHTENDDGAGDDTKVPPPAPYESPIDFEALWETNKDIYAWLEIPGTEIAYPIVQSEEDDAYYLEHTVEGAAGLPGSIYTEKVHGKDFSVFNTVIYGHNMKNGTMFGSLKSYRDSAFLEEHREIVVYLPEAEYHYKIFAAVMYSNAYLPTAFDYESETGRQGFLDSVTGVRDLNSHVLEDVEVTPESRLITLSTCVGNDNYRYLVVAALEEEAE